MELTGTIVFPPKKAVVLYGSNQQGKTNIINAIRYAFLRELKRSARSKKQYEEQALPTRSELVFGDKASITVEFQYHKTSYTLVRTILSKGKREESLLVRSNRPDQPEDLENFLRGRLKVSLLDALFAPDIAQGFKQLYSGAIDQSVAEMFKEITASREIATALIQRSQRLKGVAEAKRVMIKGDHFAFCDRISRMSSSMISTSEFKNFERFDPGTTFQRLDNLHSSVRRAIEKLKEEGFGSELAEAINKARELAAIRKKVNQEDFVGKELARLKDLRLDHRILRLWMLSVNKIVKVEDPLKTIPSLRDTTLETRIQETCSILKNAKSAKMDAVRMSSEERIKLVDVEALLKDLRKLAILLKRKAKIGKELGATVTKVSGKVYTVLPFELLAKDASFRDINRQPIPKGEKAQKQKYLDQVQNNVERLDKIRELSESSANMFESFAKNGKKSLTKCVDTLDEVAKRLEEKTELWVKDLASATSSFTGRRVLSRRILDPVALGRFVALVNHKITKAELRYLNRTRRLLRQVNIPVTKFDVGVLVQAEEQVSKLRKELPNSEKVERLIAERKISCEKIDEDYLDYSRSQPIADHAIAILKTVVSKCFDEAKLRQSIGGTYAEMISLMRERHLIRALPEVVPGSLKTVVKYKGKIITHPAGSEKAFFSLAILSGLARFFQTPVLVDEVANNLDSKNLRAFFELVKEFKDRYGIQYVLSIKETNDFDFDGWVRNLRDDMAIHRIDDKTITQMVVA